MSLSADLLDQATHLANRERRRPRQASLRRAVSSAYYALFHRLTDDACSLLVAGQGASRDQLRHVLRRAFAHGEMRAVSKSFGGGNLPAPWCHAGAVGQASPDLRQVALAFVELQEARHRADYDLSRPFSKQEALDFVQQSSAALQAWDRCRRSQEGDVFLVALLTNKQLRG